MSDWTIPTKALSLIQPSPSDPLHLREPVAYLAGVLLGDAWLSKPSAHAKYGYLALRVADEDFARAFAAAIEAGFGLAARVRKDERGYWLVARHNRDGRFFALRGFEANSDEQRAAWLRGLFDSEGNVRFKRFRSDGHSACRRVAVYSTNTSTLDTAAMYFESLSMRTRRNATKPSAGHKGTLVVYELALRDRHSFETFATSVGSSIGRKQRALDDLVAAYPSDPAAAYRAAQRRGADTKNRLFDAERWPELARALREREALGLPMTQEACARLPAYYAAQHRMTHAEILIRAGVETRDRKHRNRSTTTGRYAAIAREAAGVPREASHG